MAGSEDVYCTLLMNDAYLPGAFVLAHSLRDCGTAHKLACLVTEDTLTVTSLDELRALYDYVIPVPRIGNPNPTNLYLMNRADLLYAFTKITLWRQTQFRKIVYLDADVVALRAPDELFDLQERFAAAPDVGWPDAFNTGVMLITPNEGEYRALSNMASAGDSFDGADQGLLNQYFENKPWKRLSFAYNCTPSANYQYEPAYRYHKSNISLLHFIGRQKPWTQPRSQSTGVYQELLSRWWAVYDRHHVVDEEQASHAVTNQPTAALPVTAPKAKAYQAKQSDWDATRGPPPMRSAPEAANFPSQTYQFNSSQELFNPPASYPDPPKDMWFEVPAQRAKPDVLPAIFPWEERRDHQPSRRFAEDEPPAETKTESPDGMDLSEFAVQAEVPVTPTISVTDSGLEAFSGVNRNAWDEISGIDNYVRALTSRHKTRGSVQVLQNDASKNTLSSTALDDADLGSIVETARERRESLILTDFPSAIERPSLPVTPAPRRRAFWGEETDEEGVLPSAEGVPSQSEWDPAEQLEQLRKNSLLGPEQLKLAVKSIPNRAEITSNTTHPAAEELV